MKLVKGVISGVSIYYWSVSVSVYFLWVIKYNLELQNLNKTTIHFLFIIQKKKLKTKKMENMVYIEESDDNYLFLS